MMTKNEQIASLLLEAAELLKESSGRNGYVSGGESKRYGKDAARYYAKTKETKDRLSLAMGDFCKSIGCISVHPFKNDKDDKDIDFAERFANKSKVNENDTYARYKDEQRRRDKAMDYKKKRASLKEAIDLLYNKAVTAETMDEAADYINKAEELEAMIEYIYK